MTVPRQRIGRFAYWLMGTGMHKDHSRRFEAGARLMAWSARTTPYPWSPTHED